MSETIKGAWYILTHTDSEGKKHMTGMRIPDSSNLAAIYGYDSINHCSSKAELDRILTEFNKNN